MCRFNFYILDNESGMNVVNSLYFSTMFRSIGLAIIGCNIAYINEKITSGRGLSCTKVKYSDRIKFIIPKNEIILTKILKLNKMLSCLQY